MKKYFLLSALLAFLASFPVFAVPYADIELKSKLNGDGTYTYKLEINNQGPILSNVATPPWHTIWTSSGVIDAGGKQLNDDDNIVLFGIDTGRDDILITMIKNKDSGLHGTEEAGWADSDNDGTKNQVVAWHPPFGPWPEGTAITHGESVEVSFTANVKLDKVLIWIGGSDDDVIWVEGNDMAEDTFGIYDGTTGHYLATFFERHIHVKHKKMKKHEHENDDD